MKDKTVRRLWLTIISVVMLITISYDGTPAQSVNVCHPGDSCVTIA